MYTILLVLSVYVITFIDRTYCLCDCVDFVNSIGSHILQSFSPSKYFVISELQTIYRTQFIGIFLTLILLTWRIG